MPYQPQIILDGQPVERITAFLFAKGGHENPKTLLANAEKSFQGSIVLGMGFTFDDTNPEATPIAEMERLIAANPRNQERIFPYIGGSEVNSSPTHEHHRYVIDFFDRSEEEAWEWPDLMQIVKEKVKPERDVQKRDALRIRWWQYAEKRPGLVRAIATCDRVLVAAQTSKYKCFTFLPKGYVYDQKLVVFSLDSFSAFAAIHTRTHENWVLFMGSSMKDDPVYTPSDCFETFPFPPNWETDPTLETIGQTYYDYRAVLMIRNNQGLTDTYNRFHDPEERDPDLLKLRDLHDQMDRAVLNAYGWPDIDTTCGFALDYLDADPDDLPTEAQDRIAAGDLFFATPDEAAAFDALVQSGLKKRKKLPWRYRWPETTHDEVLARLLDLNQKRHEEEVLGHKAAKKTSTKNTPTSSRTKRSKSTASQDLPSIPGLLDHD